MPDSWSVLALLRGEGEAAGRGSMRVKERDVWIGAGRLSLVVVAGWASAIVLSYCFGESKWLTSFIWCCMIRVHVDPYSVIPRAPADAPKWVA